jgi:hypothetical protein
MWVFMTDSFLSIVADKTSPNHLLVRARLPRDIIRVFPEAKVVKTDYADYMYRASIAVETVALAMVDEVRSINYANFKDKAASLGGVPDQDERVRAYHWVWTAMADCQDRVDHDE